MLPPNAKDYVEAFRKIRTIVDQEIQGMIGPLGRLQVTLKILELMAADMRADRSRSSR